MLDTPTAGPLAVALRDGRNVNATITSPVFYDPNSERQNA